MSNEATNTELLAAIAAIAVTGRRLIEGTASADPEAAGKTFAALHEFLAVSGGSVMVLAQRLSCEAEVERLVMEGQNRITAYQASQGLEGRA
ncbi:MAG: hypothetical protein U5N10_02165 [Gemmobacter sp.]|nr:hypothetical protein [Gemmobacter sp.]